MTLFTLARALISASHVCCVALPSAYQQTTSAAPYNHSFEGFLSAKKKDKERVRTTATTKRHGKMEGKNTPVHKRIRLRFQTHTNGRDSFSFSFCLFTFFCLLDFLSLRLIRLLVQIKVIWGDSLPSDEPVCVVIALMKWVVLEAKKGVLDNKRDGGLFLSQQLHGSWKNVQHFCELGSFLIYGKCLVC